MNKHNFFIDGNCNDFFDNNYCNLNNQPSCFPCNEKQCNCCTNCPPGPMGPQGPAGGILDFADFFAVMPPDNSATVAPRK